MSPRIPTSCRPGYTGHYIVRPGDTMYAIAQFFRTRLEALAVNNPHITNPNVLFPGDVLCVPGLIPFPCCIMLQPRVALPVGTDASAFVHVPSTGSLAVTVAATLPQPSVLGNYNIYLATVLIPEIQGGFGDVLYPNPQNPPTYSTTITIPTAAQLTPSSRVIIQPFREGEGVSGPTIMEGSLGACH
ncbi:MAG TPA: LysM peptidoglycan-binding domain-containing protein [Bacillota bacterium]|nr:LysM peptidoglycan-binding domain-containing protein [Bacillota bacterium]